MTSRRKAYFVGGGTQRLNTHKGQAAGKPLGAQDKTMTGCTTTLTWEA